MEIKDVFGAQPKSVWEYLCENGQGLYVPAYQRQYSWDTPKITRLIEDICHGFTTLTSRDDAITFLGTIIAIHDTNLVTVDPIVKGDVPSRVMTIIDGQQRLTTLLLVNTVLHEEIKLRLVKKRSKSSDEDADVWLIEECMKVIGRLAKTFEENKDYGDPDFQYYPRMIRAYDDSWSRKKDKASYKSAIGHYLHTYGKYGREEIKKNFKYEPPESEQENSSKYKPLSEGRKTVYKLIKNISKCIDSGAKVAVKSEQMELELPEFTDILDNDKFQNLLLKSEFPESVKAKLSDVGDHSFEELTRLVLFANFVLDRVAITIVTAKNEDYAFDMFESLNTTGEPLTAFETFKPKIINAEKLSGYEKSKSHQYVKAIEDYLESTGKSNDKQDTTSRLIVTFALAEKGEKLSKRLSDQRRFLKDSFESFPGLEQQQEYVRYLSHAALFIRYSWPEDKSKATTISSAEEAQTDEVILCIDLLRKFNHTITLGPLIRFYSEIRRVAPEYRGQAINNFIDAVKAITAFSVLWRSSRRSTENIDSHYRKLMLNGYADVGLKPLARNNNDFGSEITLNVIELKKAFLSILERDGHVGSKEDWVKAISKIPAYSNQKEITRFILLAAAHDSVEDKANPGLTVAGRPGILPLLDVKNWTGEQSKTIEHIAPQEKESKGWLEDIYEDPELIDRLGNLTLLPIRENSSLKNGSWEKKKLFYKILSAMTPDELEPLLEQGKAQNINLAQSTNDLLIESKYLPLVKSVTTVEGDWTKELIEKRSVRIAELAWERIHAWLAVE
ncbi:DUF262 domain-containing protein [Salmonella enterica subsp. enterica serovar 4,12:d:-]|uniref:DUF262 domain-containing protein n=2 Tax=Salmonella enterica I TaxID=59201 RepID=A0A6Y2UZM7_SALET|nr:MULTISPECIES: DUF262 domain-containing HNH endonuclease family protein [Enterobacteriaceae]EBC9133373.1 DUF262 domain-containing protein [Salmonella enterica subsp. enterica serovar Heidelberg]EDU0588815.1 DUF262 domain-containing protein [Salmonella enterica subsp. enterica serovar Sandiego]EDU3817749.1 DUF262 domain-containing protein [Salmonella enterica subsp. enterica serovar 4,[5],12:i:-]EGF1375876.1 DUF262 domain-containing protein [Salmonella enterica subsp. enterica serovar 4,[5],12